MLRKRKTLVGMLSIIFCIIIAFTTNTENAKAFGGDYIITDVNGSSYSKELCCQITTSFASNGDLIVEGYAFFTYVQQYLSKGTGTNNTHSYRLKLEGWDKVYNDVLVGGSDYTSLAEDSSYTTLNANSTYVCKSTQNYNTQLQQVTFKFVIPASDLAKLSASQEQYKLILECTLSNIRFASNSSTKHTKVFNVTKLANVNFIHGNTISKDYTTDSEKKNITVITEGIGQLRVNANRVVARDSNKNKFTSYNSGYFVKGGLSATEEEKQRNWVYSIDTSKSSLSSSYVGEVMWPLIVRYDKKTSSTINLTLDELFTKYPSLRTEYHYNQAKIAANVNKITSIALNTPLIKNCKKHYPNLNIPSIAAKKDTSCDVCLMNNGYYVCLTENYTLNQRNAEIEKMCTTTATSSSTVTTTLYCKAIYLEAQKGAEYSTYIQVKNIAQSYDVITQRKIENVNSTTMGAAETLDTDSVMGSVNGFNYNYVLQNANVTNIKGYHMEVLTETLTNTSISKPNLSYTKAMSFNINSPRTVVVTVEYRNSPPVIVRRTQ